MKCRIREFVKHLGITQKEFCEKCAIKQPDLSSNKTNNIGRIKRMRIYQAYPELNPLWLEYGVGSMLQDGSKAPGESSDALLSLLNIANEQMRALDLAQRRLNNTYKDILNLLHENNP
jgi:hypothetical protein